MGKDWYEGCIHSREWRLNHLYYINTKTQGVIRFKMNWAQQAFFKGLWNKNNVLKARQLGLSTLVAMLILDSCLFNNNFVAGIIDKTEDDGKEKLLKIKLAYNSMLYPPKCQYDHVEDEEDRKNIQAFAQAVAKTAGGKFKEKSGNFNNGSYVKIGTSLRGGTIHLLHVSEYGSVAANHPKKANEVLTGGIQAVADDRVVIMESTHEGGKYGKNYELTREAMENVGKPMDQNMFKFFFFPWHGQEEYALPKSEADVSELSDYWSELEEQGITLSMAQKRWYISKYRTLGMMMKREFPSTPEEAFANQVDGAIYGKQIDRLRAQGKIAAEFEPEPNKPYYVSWDIGMSDYMAMWLIQPGGDGKYYVLDYYCNHNLPLGHYINKVQQWERDHDMLVARHLLPHDSGKRDINTGKTFNDYLMEAGFKTSVVPRTKSIWAGITAVRDILSHCVFHERCSRSITWDTEIYMSGIDALENYQTGGLSANGVERKEPLHDACSHGADAFRYFCEAVAHGLVSREGARKRESLPETRYKRPSGTKANGVPAWW